jgi:hypothetical protein
VTVASGGRAVGPATLGHGGNTPRNMAFINPTIYAVKFCGRCSNPARVLTTSCHRCETND